jgi:mannose-1-phosphate guanylyltransferase/phosphomannomutase
MSETQHKRGFYSRNVSGIVLAGTYHWSGSPFEELKARPLLPVVLKPIIGHVLQWLDQSGISETTICANGSTGALRRHFESAYSSTLALRYHEDGSPRGAAGCVKDAANQSQADTFVVTDGASIPTSGIRELVAHHIEKQAELTVVAHKRLSPGSATPQYYPTGTFVFDRSVLDAIPATSFHDIKESLIPKLYREGRRIELFEVGDMSPRVRNAESYLALNRWMLERLVTSSELATHPTAWIDKSATIIGPVVLGEGVRVHASATIVGPSVIGAGTTVRSGATVARSIMWDECVIGERSFVDQCVVTERGAVDDGETLAGVLRVQSVRNMRHRAQASVPSANAIAKPAVS